VSGSVLARLLLGLAICLAAGCASTPSSGSAARKCFHADERSETEIGYCQAIRSGNRLYISGTVGRGEMPAAVKMAYERLRKTLETNGLTFANVVEERVFTTDLDAFKASKDLRKSYYGSTFPAATWVQVQRLFVPELVVEVELVAEYPE
jgi:enamine deaminase RidA (YjgF/YER057c/UK114 family)